MSILITFIMKRQGHLSLTTCRHQCKQTTPASSVACKGNTYGKIISLHNYFVWQIGNFKSIGQVSFERNFTVILMHLLVFLCILLYKFSIFLRLFIFFFRNWRHLRIFAKNKKSHRKLWTVNSAAEETILNIVLMFDHVSFSMFPVFYLLLVEFLLCSLRKKDKWL